MIVLKPHSLRHGTFWPFLLFSFYFLSFFFFLFYFFLVFFFSAKVLAMNISYALSNSTFSF